VHLIEVELLVGCMHSEVVSSGSSTLHSSSKGVPNESALEHLKIHSTFSSGGFSNNLFAPYACRGEGEIHKGKDGTLRGIPFSAFWLRSSVVSVLISLISDTRLIESHDINLIF
jgi:hypothetical protein